MKIRRFNPYLLLLLMAFSADLTGTPAFADHSPTHIGSGNCGQPVDGVFTWTSGYVRDLAGRAIQGALVHETRMPSESSFTDSNGRYELKIWAHCPTTLNATHSRFETRISEEVNFATPVIGPNFSLPYRIQNPSVSPQAVNYSPQKSLSFSVSAGPINQSEAWVWAQPLSGPGILLSPSGTSGALTVWNGGAWPVQLGLSDGSYQIKFCVVSANSVGNCDFVDPASGVVMSSLVSTNFLVDTRPPETGGVTPNPYHLALNRRPLIGPSGPNDGSGSGIDYTRSEMRLDGVRVSDGHPYRPPGNLSLDYHNVEIDLTDRAGNTYRGGWLFSVAQMAADAADGLIAEKQAGIEFDQSTLKYKATFVGAEASLSRYLIHLSSSPFWSGKGSGTRKVPFGDIDVYFINEFGQRERATARAGDVSFGAQYATVAGSEETLVAGIASSKVTLPTFSVEAPAGFVVTEQSYAVIEAVTRAALGFVPLTQWEWLDPLPYTVSGSGTVSGILTCHVSSQTLSGCNGLWPEVYWMDGSTRVAVLAELGDIWAGLTLPDASTTSDRYPHPNPLLLEDVACGDVAVWTCGNVIRPGYAEGRARTYWRAGTLFAAYGHQYLFSITSTATATLASWQASDIDLGSYSSMTTGERFACLQKFGNTIESVAGMWNSDPAVFAPTLYDMNLSEYRPLVEALASRGYRLGAGPGEGVDLGPLRADGQLKGTFASDPSKSVSFRTNDGVKYDLIPAQANGSFNSWEPDALKKKTDTSLLTATGFAGSDLNDFTIRFGLFFEFSFVSGTCQ